MLPPGGIPLSRRVYLPEYEFSMDFAGLKQMRIRKAIANPRESSKCLRILETLSSVMSQKTLNKPKQLENAEHKKEMLETLKTQHKYNNQRTPKKQRNSIIRKTTLPPAAGRDVPQSPLHLSVLHPRSNVAAWPGSAAALPGPARRGQRRPDKCPAIARG